MKLRPFLRQAALGNRELLLTLVNGESVQGVPGLLEMDSGVDTVPMFLDGDSDYPTIVVIEHIVTAKRTGRTMDLP